MSGKSGVGPKKSTKGSRSSKAVTRGELHGGKVRVPENPPEITFQPWNALVVVDSITNKQDFTVHHLTRQMWSQLDPNTHAFKSCPNTYTTNEFRLLFKIQQIRAWALAGKMIALSVEDFMVPNKDLSAVDQLCGIVDVGNATHIPGLGYRLPIAHQNCVFRDTKDNDQTLFQVIADGPAIVYVNVLWRCDGPSKLPQFNAAAEQSLRDIRNYSLQSTRDTRNIKINTDTVLEKLDEIIKNQPTILSEISNEIPVAAAAVAVTGVRELREVFSDLMALRETLSECSSFDAIDKSEAG
uniref:ORF1 n=1 Tax=Chaq virus-like 1 TaxID=1903431 RepID=A0A1C9U5E4_9VIRU|nr:ORF1 [Chaq virus-like 1]